MDKKKFQDLIDPIKIELISARQNNLKYLRKNDPDIIKANNIYSERAASLAHNHALAAKEEKGGLIDFKDYERQLTLLKEDRDEKENAKIRPGFINIKNEMLHNAFEENPEQLEQAKKEFEDDPDLQWLKDPKEIQQEKQEEKSINEANTSLGNHLSQAQSEFNEKGRKDVSQVFVEQVEPNNQIEKDQSISETFNRQDLPEIENQPGDIPELETHEVNLNEYTSFETQDHYPIPFDNPPPEGEELDFSDNSSPSISQTSPKESSEPEIGD